jgi:hypothetical protein
LIEGLISNARTSRPPPDSILQPGEQLIWSQRPKKLRFAARGGGYLAAGAVLLVLNTLGIWKIFDQPDTVWLLNVTISVILMLVPVFRLLISPSVYYAISDARAIIVRGNAMRDIELAKIKSIDRVQHPFGITDILFIDDLTPSQEAEGGYAHARDGFEAVTDARDVENLLRQTIALKTCT